MTSANRQEIHVLATERTARAKRLIEALTRQDEDAARALVAQFGPLVNRVVRVTLGPDQEHDDVVHRAYCEILTNVHRVESPEKLEGWVRIVTLNTARSVLRKRVVRRRHDGAMPDLDRHAHAHDSARQESRQLLTIVYGILAGFSEEHRTLFALRFIEQHSIPEIAHLCEISESTAKRKIKRAQKLFLARAKNVPELADRIRSGTTWS